MPRMCGAFVDVAGVSTNFQMPDVISFGLGGGSMVAWQQQQQQQQQPQQEQRECSIGPLSVGADLTRSCLVCGGTTATASDVAVLLHDALPGLVSKQAAAAAVPPGDMPSQQQLEIAWQAIQSRLAAGVDAAKQSAADVPLVVVGGGAGMCGATLPGVSCTVRPQHGDVAYAVGAAIPQVAGVVDTLLLLLDKATRQQQLDAVVQQAIAAAVEAGAQLSSCKVVEVDEVPVAYGSAGATRVHVKVAGDLQLEQAVPGVAKMCVSTEAGDHGTGSSAAASAQHEPALDAKVPDHHRQTQGQQQQHPTDQQQLQRQPQALAALANPQNTRSSTVSCTRSSNAGTICSSATVPASQQPSLQQLLQYRPCINSQCMWEVSELDLDAMAIGAQILGTGGGGSARHNRLKLQHAMAAAGADSATVESSPAAGTGTQQQQQAGSSMPSTTSTAPSKQHKQKLKALLIMSLTDLPDDAYACEVGGMGAPTVSAEKLDSYECAAAVRGLSAALPHPITALLCAEVGGGNALEPLAVGMEQGLPVVDADLMGRAFPELQMSTAAIPGVILTPAAVADDKGNVLVMAAAALPNWAEKVMR
jgi:hypothetical protein